MTRVSLGAAFLFLLSCATTAAAQTMTPPRPVASGDNLRITMTDGRTVSAVAAALNETTLQVREGSTTRSLDLKTLSRVERVIPDSIGNGIGWGVLAGFGAGAALGAMAGGCSSYCIVGRGETALLTGLMGAGAGAAVGGIADARQHRAEVVYPVTVTRRPITVVPMTSSRARGVTVLIRW